MPCKLVRSSSSFRSAIISVELPAIMNEFLTNPTYQI